MFDSRCIGLLFLRSFLFRFLKIIAILAFFHAVGIRFSDKHLVYSLANVFEMVSSPAFNVSMFIWSLPVVVPFFISRIAYSTSHDLISGISFGSVWITVLCSLSYIARCRIPLFVLWSYLEHGYLYPACLGVWSVCLGLASAFFGLPTGSVMQ